mgnify:CR=1 FL=1
MKKIVAIAAFFALIAGAAHAQRYVQQTDLRLGFQISPAFSGMATDNNRINRNGTNLGLKLGMRGEIYFRENYAFLIGLGFHFNSGGTLRHEAISDTWQRSELPGGVLRPFPGGTNLKYNLQYVEIPFGLKFRTKEFGYIRYFAEVPVISLGFKSQARGAIEYPGLKKEKVDIKKEVNSLALSWGLGGGIEYSISGSTAIIAGVGYQRMFTDVTKNYKPEVTSKAHISTIVLHLGVMF